MTYVSNTLRRFAADESGAVTVDFVVLCAAAAALAVGVGATIAGEIQSSAEGLSDTIGVGVTAAEGNITP